MEPTWLDEPTVGALRAALRSVDPELAEGTIVPRGLEPDADPEWCSASAVIDGRYIVKFAWARPPALRIRHQARVLDALRTAGTRLPLPEVVTVSDDPALLVLRRVPAVPFFEVRHRIGTAERDLAARDLATLLAELHAPRTLREVTRSLGPLPERTAHTTTDALRTRFLPLIRRDQRKRVLTWCDRADATLAAPGRTVLVHGDFHGANHLWDPETLRLRLLVDLETAGRGEPELDLCYLPADCGPALFTATTAHYENLTGTSLDLNRLMSWHLRTLLGDALWRAEAGLPLPDHRTPEQWTDDLTSRFENL